MPHSEYKQALYSAITNCTDIELLDLILTILTESGHHAADGSELHIV